MSQPEAKIDFPMRRMLKYCRVEKTTKEMSGVSSLSQTQTIVKKLAHPPIRPG